MRERGLLPDDIPELAARLMTLQRSPESNAATAMEAQRLLVELAAVRIDRGFVDRKLKRLDAQRQHNGGDASIATELMRRSQAALSYSVMGQYDLANAELTAIADLIDPAHPAAP